MKSVASQTNNRRIVTELNALQAEVDALIKFVHVMCAVLNGHTHPQPDWTYVGSRVNAVTGSRRTETYNTTLIGTTKLRHGSVYLDQEVINFKRWRVKRLGEKPPYAL